MCGARFQCGAGNGNFIARGYLCSCKKKKKIGYTLHLKSSREGERTFPSQRMEGM